MGVGCAAHAQPARTDLPDNGQSYREAIALMCDVDSRAGITSEADPVERDTQRSDFINQHVKNPDGIELRTLLSVEPPTDRARCLGREARSVGLSGCAYAEALRNE